MKYFFIEAEYWQTLFKDKVVANRKEVFSFIQYLHGHHIGIPLQSIVCLFKMMKSSLFNTKFDCVWQTMQDEINNKDNKNKQRISIQFFLLKRQTIFKITPLIKKISIQAIQRMKKNVLFSVKSPIDKKAFQNFEEFSEFYEDYTKEFNQSIKDIITSKWSVGLLSEIKVAKYRTDAVIQTFDMPLLHMMTGDNLTPELTPPLKHQSLLAKLIRTKKDSLTTLAKEGGIRGIRQSHRLADFEDILFSELLLPRPLLLDKIFNEGFLIKNRPAKAKDEKELLILGVMPNRRYNAEETLLKTCWFHFCCWATAILHRAGLKNSEFLWIEGDQLDGARWFHRKISTNDGVNNITTTSKKLPKSIKNKEMRENKWIPHFIEQKLSYTTDASNHKNNTQRINHWLKQAIKMALKNKNNRTRTTMISNKLNEYNLVLCQTITTNSNDVFFENLYESFRSFEYKKNISLIQMSTFSKIPDWRYGARGYGKQQSLSEIEGEYDKNFPNIDQLSGEIITFWLTILQEAILND